MSYPRTTGEPDITIYLDDQVIAYLLLDSLQDTFPWCCGTLVEGPALERWRGFVDAYHDADIEFDYCPHHPQEGAYEDTELAGYIEDLRALARERPAADEVSSAQDHRLAPWIAAPPDRLSDYIAFLDHRRWRAINRDGDVVVGIALPPSLDFETRQFSFR